MDYFEKAHVVKRNSSRKEHKSEGAVKKELKQMLSGYKKSASNLIKHCEDTFDPNKFDDDSSSVSGFSDLNLTNSSNGIDDFVTSDKEEESASCSKVIRANQPSNFNLKDEKCENSVFSLESISEYGDDNQTISDNASLEVTLDSSSLASDMISLDTSVAESVTENDFDQSELFDADGSLANKILEQLEKEGIVKKRAKKRKLNVKKPKTNKHEVNTDDLSDVVLEDCSMDIDDQAIVHEEAKEHHHDSISDTNSSDFVSVSASEMPTQSLSDILGEYRHPTIKNLPSESQNLGSTNNSGIFSVEEMNVEDIQIQEDTSMSPQLDDDSDSDLNSKVINVSDTDISLQPATGTTSAYDTSLQSEDTSDKEVSLPSLDSSYLSTVKVFYGQSSCILVLKHPAELYIHGKVTVKALVGTVEIFGHTLKEKPVNVYAPNYKYALSLKTVENENRSSGLFRKLVSEGVSVLDAEEIVTGIGQFDGVVSLKRLASAKMDFVENNFSAVDLFSKMGKNVDNSLKRACQLLGCSLYITKPWIAFEELPIWNQALKCGSEEHSRGIICGGKGLGKSTSLRYCVNRLLHQGPVLVIDLDPGQAEFTVAGNISATVVKSPLLGPNFTHLTTPVRMLNIGMINIMDNPRRYGAAVTDLIRHCNNDEQLQLMPWLINTMGMCNAMGLKFMTLVILQAQPTYLFQIDSKNAKKRFETLLNPHNVKKLYDSYKYDSLFKNIRNPELNYAFLVSNHSGGSGKNHSSVSPRDERYLNFLAYFGELLRSRHDTSLLGITPFEVKLGDLHIGFNIKITDEAVTKVINGKIIALCQLTTLDKNGKVFTLRDKPLLCHGHGLIRGVDLEKGTLYILTPTPVDKLSVVDSLVYADWVPELRGQEKHLPDGIPIPYRTDTTYQQRQLMFAPKRRFNPLQLLKIARNS